MYFCFIILLLLQVIYSSGSGAETIPVNKLDPTWDILYSQFRHLKCQRFHRKIFYKEMENIRILAQVFFSKDPLKAFAALENHSNDIGLLFFFFDLISSDGTELVNEMMVDYRILWFFSFRESLKKNLPDIHLGSMIRKITCYVNSIKTNDLLVIVVRIFGRIEKEISTYSKFTLPEISKAIEGWRYEMFISNNMKQEEVANNMKQEESTQLEELLDIFHHVKYLIRYKKGSDSLLKHLFGRFRELTGRFRELTDESVISLNTLSFLVGQRVEFIILFFFNHKKIIAFESFLLFFKESGGRNLKLKKTIVGDVFLKLNRNEALSLSNSHVIQIEDGQSESDKALFRILNKIKSFYLKL